MVKHTQTIRRLLPTNCLSVFDHFVGLALKVLDDIISGESMALNVSSALTHFLLMFPFDPLQKHENLWSTKVITLQNIDFSIFLIHVI